MQVCSKYFIDLALAGAFSIAALERFDESALETDTRYDIRITINQRTFHM